MANSVSVCPAPDPEWWLDHTCVAALIRWLDDQCEITTISQAADIVAQPWKWTPEWERMQRGDSMDDDEDAEPPSAEATP